RRLEDGEHLAALLDRLDHLELEVVGRRLGEEDRGAGGVDDGADPAIERRHRTTVHEVQRSRAAHQACTSSPAPYASHMRAPAATTAPSSRSSAAAASHARERAGNGMARTCG